jgi:hypothetical protein
LLEAVEDAVASLIILSFCQQDEAVDTAEADSVSQGWQVCYACLLLLEKIVGSSPAQVHFNARIA